MSGRNTSASNNRQADINRRDFLAAASAFTLALTVSPDPRMLNDEARADAPLPLSVWVTISTDGTITVVSPAAELGQGTFTTLPAVFADELDAEWSKVRPVMP